MAINSATLNINFQANQSSTNAFGGSFSPIMALSQSFANGTLANQFDQLYCNQRTIASATNDDIDLNGIITDAFGAILTAVELVGVIILNQQVSGAANTTNLTIGGGTNPVVGYLGGTTPTVGPIKPGGCFALMNPDSTGIATITASTADILRVANSSGASVTYQIALLMRSA